MTPSWLHFSSWSAPPSHHHIRLVTLDTHAISQHWKWLGKKPYNHIARFHSKFMTAGLKWALQVVPWSPLCFSPLEWLLLAFSLSSLCHTYQPLVTPLALRRWPHPRHQFKEQVPGAMTISQSCPVLWWWFGHFSHVWFSAAPWTVAHQAPLAMGFSWQEYCSG